MYDAKIGPYCHPKAWKAEKTFEGGRSFSVLISTAEDHGIIGSELNGLLILDNDNHTVVLDQHLKQPSGSGGPSRAQIEAYRKILDMDWPAFSAFCRGNSRYRQGSAPDLDTGTGPDPADELQQAISKGEKATGKPGRDIRPPSMILADKDKEVDYSFPLKTRDDMTAFLANHKLYRPDYHGPVTVAWNIRLAKDGFSTDGKAGEKVEDRFDAKWKEYVEQNENAVFERAQESALRMWLEDEYTTYCGGDDPNEQGKIKFTVSGQRGGQMVLLDWNGPTPKGPGHPYPLSFDDSREYVDWLKDLSDQDLAKFYALIVNVDHDLNNRHAEMECQYSFIRTCMEEEWSAEAKAEETASPSP